MTANGGYLNSLMTKPELTAAELKALRALVEASNATAVSRALGVTRGVVVASLSGATMHAGSVALVRAALVARARKAAKK